MYTRTVILTAISKDGVTTITTVPVTRDTAGGAQGAAHDLITEWTAKMRNAFNVPVFFGQLV